MKNSIFNPFEHRADDASDDEQIYQFVAHRGAFLHDLFLFFPLVEHLQQGVDAGLVDVGAVVASDVAVDVVVVIYLDSVSRVAQDDAGDFLVAHGVGVVGDDALVDGVGGVDAQGVVKIDFGGGLRRAASGEGEQQTGEDANGEAGEQLSEGEVVVVVVHVVGVVFSPRTAGTGSTCRGWCGGGLLIPLAPSLRRCGSCCGGLLRARRPCR